MYKTGRLALALLLISLLALSCRKDGSGPSWDVDVLVPIVKTELTLKNLVADSLLASDPNGALSIAFDGTVFRLNLDTLVEIPNETIQETFILPFGTIYLQPGEPIPSLGNALEATKYNLNAVELKKIKIRSGFLTFQLSSSIQEAVELSYTMQNATISGTPFSVTEIIPAGTQTAQSVITRTYDLSGYTIDMRGVNLNDFNTIVAEFAAIISPSATDSVAITQGDKFDIKYTFDSIKPEFAEGFFGSYSVSDALTDTIDIFKNIASGFLNIDSIGMEMRIENGFGIDAQLTLDTFRSINTVTGASVDLSHSSIGNSINLSRALNMATSETPFTYSQFNLTMNTQNSNVDQLIETLPDRIRYAFEIDINPFGNNSNGNDFLYFDSDLKISMDLKIPARFSANGLTILDTVDFDLGKDPKKDHETTITGGFFYLYADNGFPFEARFQLYLYDENFVLLDSLLLPTNNTVLAAPVDLNNRVTSKLQSRLDIAVDDDKIIVLENAKKAMIKVIFTTQPNNQIMTIFSDYAIDLKLVGDFTYRAKVN